MFAQARARVRVTPAAEGLATTKNFFLTLKAKYLILKPLKKAA